MKKQKPFFAKFMESQFSNEEAKNVKGGDPGNACNTPAALHNPNCPPIFVTLKFPSDWEDNGGGGGISI